VSIAAWHSFTSPISFRKLCLRHRAACVPGTADVNRTFPHQLAEKLQMKILEHPESHIVKLDDGSTWQIFLGDIDHTLTWMPTTELRLFEINDQIASHALINCDDGTRVRVRPLGERWPAAKVKHILGRG
jgi:hypothetical protein